MGARYTFNSLVTNPTPKSMHSSPSASSSSSLLPPSLSALNLSPRKKNTFSASDTSPFSPSSAATATTLSTAAAAAAATTTTTTTTTTAAAVVTLPLTQHQRSASSHKSFNAFLMDTNDEWSDTLEYSPVVRQDPARLASLPEDSLPHITTNHNTPTTTTPTTISPTPKNNPSHLLFNDLHLFTESTKISKFKQVLSSSNVDLDLLRKLSWSGIPKEIRFMVWQLLLGHLPCNSTRRSATLARKRKEYADSVAASYTRGTAGLDQTLWHQIHIDIPRTNPGIPLYQYEITQMCLERILYQWAIRHPASGYVQGINDLVTPIFEVFLSAYIEEDPEEYDIRQLDKELLDVIEADSFWCLSKLLDGIQDNYTFAQPGIQRQITTLRELVSRIDVRLALHLQNQGIEFIQFAFRWMNCLLMRELPLKSTIRMWDTYLAEGSSEGFSEFHVYVCAAFLVKWSDQLQKLDFQGVMMFLQQLPTQGWAEKDVELLLSEAYMWKTLFHNAPNHLK
ncbi:rab-GTPase-TBC domain-containing protein [Spinellus fusiger]|nr:rab-GTPase-TBC domain-containing protein [Spinellus fusiger]